MSKAFTKEDDRESEDGIDDIQVPSSPAGSKNYMTPTGAKILQAELHQLKSKTRPEVVQTVAWAAGNGDRSENGDYIYGKKRLREIDRRIRFLVRRLDNVEIVDPLKTQSEQVRFGATVTFADQEDRQRTYSIVGIDEADVSKGRISWISPIAAALMKAREGDVVQFNSPKGLQEIEVIKIEYKEVYAE